MHNARLLMELENMAAPANLKTMETLGSHSSAFEAQAFAILAYQRIKQVCANLPQVTGARHPVVLGSVTPGRSVPNRL